MIEAQVNQSQARGVYGVSLSADHWHDSDFTIYGTPAEIRVLLDEIERRLTECEAADVEAIPRAPTTRRRVDGACERQRRSLPSS